jgi:hypothetical protein
MRSTALSLDQFRRRHQPRANINADPWPNALVALFDGDADVAKWVDPMPSARICQSPNVLRLHHEPPKRTVKTRRSPSIYMPGVPHLIQSFGEKPRHVAD